MTDLYIAPNGNDANTGLSAAHPLRTLTEAWNRLPTIATTTGYRLNLLPGTYPCEPGELDNCQNYFSDRDGTFQYPIIIQATSGTVILRGGLNLARVSYLYLIDLNLVGGGALPTNSAGNNLLGPG